MVGCTSPSKDWYMDYSGAKQKRRRRRCVPVHCELDGSFHKATEAKVEEVAHCESRRKKRKLQRVSGAACGKGKRPVFFFFSFFLRGTRSGPVSTSSFLCCFCRELLFYSETGSIQYRSWTGFFSLDWCKMIKKEEEEEVCIGPLRAQCELPQSGRSRGGGSSSLRASMQAA